MHRQDWGKFNGLYNKDARDTEIAGIESGEAFKRHAGDAV